MKNENEKLDIKTLNILKIIKMEDNIGVELNLYELFWMVIGISGFITTMMYSIKVDDFIFLYFYQVSFLSISMIMYDLNIYNRSYDLAKFAYEDVLNKEDMNYIKSKLLKLTLALSVIKVLSLFYRLILVMWSLIIFYRFLVNITRSLGMILDKNIRGLLLIRFSGPFELLLSRKAVLKRKSRWSGYIKNDEIINIDSPGEFKLLVLSNYNEGYYQGKFKKFNYIGRLAPYIGGSFFGVAKNSILFILLNSSVIILSFDLDVISNNELYRVYFFTLVALTFVVNATLFHMVYRKSLTAANKRHDYIDSSYFNLPYLFKVFIEMIAYFYLIIKSPSFFGVTSMFMFILLTVLMNKVFDDKQVNILSKQDSTYVDDIFASVGMDANDVIESISEINKAYKHIIESKQAK